MNIYIYIDTSRFANSWNFHELRNKQNMKNRFQDAILIPQAKGLEFVDLAGTLKRGRPRCVKMAFCCAKFWTFQVEQLCPRGSSGPSKSSWSFLAVVAVNFWRRATRSVSSCERMVGSKVAQDHCQGLPRTHKQRPGGSRKIIPASN